MKRNNGFMIAYIAFLFAAAIIKCYWEFPAWNALVLAVTVSSSFLAIAESFGFVYSFKNAYESEQRSAIKKVCDFNFHTEKSLEDFIKQLDQSDNLSEEYADLKEKLVKWLDEVKSRKTLSKECEKLDKAEKINKIFLILSFVLTVVGFLLFFCVLVFPPVTEYCAKDESVYTVFSFAIVLSSQFFNSFTNNEISKARSKRDEIIQDCFAREKEFEVIKAELITKYKMEAVSNAH